MKQRAYERREKLTQKQVKGKGQAISNTVLVSFSAKLSKLENPVQEDQPNNEKESVSKTHLGNNPKAATRPPDTKGVKLCDPP